MTITQNLKHPLFVVIGATGAQGGSVVKALQRSSLPYRVRGFTRDASRPASKALKDIGVELYEATIKLGNEAAVTRGFEGAMNVFVGNAMSAYDEETKQQEIDEGKLMIDAAKAVGAKHTIWSTLTSFTKLSKGKYTKAYTWDAKADVAEYAKGTGIPLSTIEAGGYNTNFLRFYPPRKVAEGKYVVSLPSSGDAEHPLIWIEEDFGEYVRAIVEAPELGPGTVGYTGQWTKLKDAVATIAKVTGYDVVYEEIKDLSHIPPFLVDAMKTVEEFGGYAPDADVNALLPYLNHQPHSFADWVKSADWSGVFK